MSEIFPIRPLFTLRTATLAGRDTELNKLQTARQALADAHQETRLFYIAGAGGMGKTRLLEWIQEQPVLAGELRTGIIDFYNSVLRTDIDLVEQIVDDLEKARNPQVLTAFATFDKLREKFRAQQSAAVDTNTRNEAIQAFEQAWQALSTDYRLIVLLDTAELLRFDDDDVRKRFDAPLPVASAKRWVTEVVKENRLPRALFVVAGRKEEASTLYNELCELARAEAVPAEARIINLEGLDATGANAYIDYLADTLRTQGYERAASVLSQQSTEGFDAELRQAFYKLTAGLPIALAIALQLYIDGTSMELNRLVDDQLSGQPVDLTLARQHLREALVQALGDYAFGVESSLAIRYMALARKGLNPARLDALCEGEAPHDHKAVLDHLRKQIFFKVRPDSSLVLHDEIATWVEEGLFGNYPERIYPIYSKSVSQYNKEIKAQDGEIEQLSQQSERLDVIPDDEVDHDETTLDTATIEHFIEETNRQFREIRRKRRTLTIDRMAYALLWNPVEGYKYYYELAEEAFNVGRMDYEAQIRAEFLHWWYQEETPGSAAYKFRVVAQAAGITEELVNADFAIRAVQRQYNDFTLASTAERLQATVKLVTNILQDETFHLPAFSRIALQVYADTARGQLATNEQETEAIRQSFQTNIDQLRLLLQEIRQTRGSADIQTFLTRDALAFAYYESGFFESAFGNYGEAIQHFIKSLKGYRDLGFEINQARSLNDVAYCLAMVGESVRSEAMVDDGLNLRKRLGFNKLVALSYNTKGIVATLYERPVAAVHYCRRALRTFARLGDDYGRMLAYRALSEAYRRSAERLPNNHADYLRKLERALEASQQAVALGRQMLGSNPTHLADILDECGCAYRDLARFRWENPAIDTTAYAHAAQEAETLIQEACDAVADISSAKSQQVDSAINLAYLHFYAVGSVRPIASALDALSNRAEIEQLLANAQANLEKAVQTIPEPFRSLQHPDHQAATERQSVYWVHLSKAFSLHVEIVRQQLRLLDQIETDLAQKTVVEDRLLQYAILLLYFINLFPGNVRNVRRSTQVVYSALKDCNSATHERFYHQADTMSKALGIPSDKNKQYIMRHYLQDNFGAE